MDGRKTEEENYSPMPDYIPPGHKPIVQTFALILTSLVFLTVAMLVVGVAAYAGRFMFGAFGF